MGVWGDVGEIALAGLSPTAYGALKGIRERNQLQEAQPVLDTLFDPRNESDPNFSQDEWRKGMAGLAQTNFPDNPMVQKGVLDYVTQNVNNDALQNIITGKGTPADYRRAATIEKSGTGLNALMKASEAYQTQGQPTSIGIDQQKFNLAQKQDAKNQEAFGNMEYLTRENTPEGVLQRASELSDVTGARPEFVTKEMSGPILQRLFETQKDKFDVGTLTAKAVRGDKEAQTVLDAMQNRELEKARANRAIITNNPMPARLNINELDDAEQVAINGAIASGKLDPYKLNSRNQKVLARAIIASPETNLNQLAAQLGFERSNATSNTKALLNTIDPLLNKLDESGKALGNMTSPGANRVVNWFKENVTGDEKLTGFKNLRDDVIAEVERGLLGTGVLSDSKYNRAIKNVNEAANYKQLQAAIRNMRQVIAARMGSLKEGPYPGAAGGNTAPVGGATVAPAGTKVPKRGGGFYTSDGKGGWY